MAALLIVVLAAVWIAFAPIQMGGQTAYVIVDGVSMEPNFHFGDLAIIRQAKSYQIGDIVAYKNIPLKRYVFHRIIDIQSDHFVLKGDNNSWNDSYQPVQSELVGKFWLYLPHVGSWVRWARQPLNMGLMAGILGGILAIGIFYRRNRNGINMKRKSIGEWFHNLRLQSFHEIMSKASQSRIFKPFKTNPLLQEQTSNPRHIRNLNHWGQTLEGIFFLLALIAFASLVLGYFAFTRPTQQNVPDNINYQQVGMFSYSANAPAGIYDSTSIHSGDPLFPKLTCLVNMRFSYALAGIQPESLGGTYQLFAKILDEQSGWQRSIPLTSQTTFVGDTFVVSAPLDLCQVESLVASVEQSTTLYPSYYSLNIVPVVAINGKVAGHELNDTFAPALVFRFDKIVFSLVNDDPKANPLNPTQAGSIKNFRTEANTLTILGTDYEVGKLRLITLIGLLISMAGIAIIAGFISNLTRQSREALLQLKYGPLLVEAHDRIADAPSNIIDVGAMEDLVKLAERNNSMILYQSRNSINFYTVRNGASTYRYALSEMGNAASPLTLVELEEDLQRGLERGEFEVYYQPILTLADGKVSGVEALMRWQHPERGLIPASEFIPVAEATGLINPLGDWLLGVACAQLKTWRDNGLPLTLSINLSEHQLRGDPAGSILRVLQNSGIDPHALQIEVPDTHIIERLQNVIPKLQDLKDRGVQIAIDDATGNSALSPLPQLPMTNIKLERPVVERIVDKEKAVNLQRMIEAARGLGLKVSAVGVETQEQLEFLRSQYCTFAQGYLIGRPTSAQELTASLLDDRKLKSTEGFKNLQGEAIS